MQNILQNIDSLKFKLHFYFQLFSIEKEYLLFLAIQYANLIDFR